ncbi:MAG TPA: ABC transporter substrate-binding protein, partial [Spirochaetota bacterium]|nr:ABC transporter substrate-binding protein [Spirochaetota bacterium]
MMKTIDDILISDYPTVLLWTAPYTRIMYWNKFDMPEDILGKYSDEDAVNGRWSVSPDKERALIDALTNNVALPAENIEYYYDSNLIK